MIYFLFFLEKIFNNQHINILYAISFIFLLVNCSSKSSSKLDVEVKELEKYKTFVSFEEGKLANPTNIRFNGDSILYVYDAEKLQVLGLSENGNIVNKYGGIGRGPGEFIRVNNIFIVDHYLYVIDQAQFRIARFELNGSLDSSLEYGQESQALPPAKPKPPFPRAKNKNNQAFVTQKGNLLLPAVKTSGNFNKLYKLVNWKGNHISDIGDIPAGSAFLLDYDKYHDAIDGREIPAFYKPNVFPVNDYSGSEYLYFVYSAYPKIVKYDISGTKRWEVDIPKTPELDSIITNFYDVSSKMNGTARIGLDTYMAGVSSSDGNLYLVLGKKDILDPSNRLWIHKFNNEGKLIQRFKLISKDVNLVPIFDIDFSQHRIFVVTEEAEIRGYSF